MIHYGPIDNQLSRHAFNVEYRGQHPIGLPFMAASSIGRTNASQALERGSIPRAATISPCGWNSRRARFKILWSNPCRCNSCQGDQFGDVTEYR